MSASDEWVDNRDTSLFARSSAFQFSRTSLSRADSTHHAKLSRLQRSSSKLRSQQSLGKAIARARQSSASGSRLPKLPSESSNIPRQVSFAKNMTTTRTIAANSPKKSSDRKTTASQESMRMASMQRVTSRSVLQRIDSASKREPSLMFKRTSTVEAEAQGGKSRGSLSRMSSVNTTDTGSAYRVRSSVFDLFGGMTAGQLTGDVIGGLNNKQLDEVVKKIGHELLCYYTPQDNIEEYFRLPEIAA